jgi:holo-[acyl-carrier protein] synthase
MILGVGTDVVNIERIEKSCERFGQRFITRVFTPEEIEQAQKFPATNKRAKMAYFAKRFAAKEAAAKALGIGFNDGVTFQDFTISNDMLGKPIIMFSGRAQLILEQLTSRKSTPIIHLSLSDDYPTAFAVVIICEDYSADD